MGDDSHQPVSFRQPRQSLHRLFQSPFIQRSKALVHKHGVQPDPSRQGLDLVGQPQSQGQGRLEGLPAGECFHAPLRAVVVVDHIQLQTALALVVGRPLPALQLILPAGHDHKPGVGPVNDPVKIRHLDVSFQHDLFLAAHRAPRGAGQGPHHGPLLFQLLQLSRAAADILPGAVVGLDSGIQLLLPLIQKGALRLQRLFVPLRRGEIHRLRLRQLLFQLADSSVHAGQFFFTAVRLRPGLFQGRLPGGAAVSQILQGLGRQLFTLKPQSLPGGEKLFSQLLFLSLRGGQPFPTFAQLFLRLSGGLLLAWDKACKLFSARYPRLLRLRLLRQLLHGGGEVLKFLFRRLRETGGGFRSRLGVRLFLPTGLLRLLQPQGQTLSPNLLPHLGALSLQLSHDAHKLCQLPGQLLFLTAELFLQLFLLPAPFLFQSAAFQVPAGGRDSLFQLLLVFLRLLQQAADPSVRLPEAGLPRQLLQTAGDLLLFSGCCSHPVSRLPAGFFRLLSGSIPPLSGLIQLRLRGSLPRTEGRPGVVQGSAHRAGPPRLQGLGQNARLAVQKRPVGCLVLCSQPLRFRRRLPIILSGPVVNLPQSSVFLGVLIELRQVLLPLFLFLQLPFQLRLPQICSF